MGSDPRTLGFPVQAHLPMGRGHPRGAVTRSQLDRFAQGLADQFEKSITRKIENSKTHSNGKRWTVSVEYGTIACMKIAITVAVAAFVVTGVYGSGATGTVKLETKHASAEVSLFGGRVLSFRKGGEEVLWRPREWRHEAGEWRHGGIPLCWPWFGSSDWRYLVCVEPAVLWKDAVIDMAPGAVHEISAEINFSRTNTRESQDNG